MKRKEETKRERTKEDGTASKIEKEKSEKACKYEMN